MFYKISLKIVMFLIICSFFHSSCLSHVIPNIPKIVDNYIHGVSADKNSEHRQFNDEHLNEAAKSGQILSFDNDSSTVNNDNESTKVSCPNCVNDNSPNVAEEQNRQRLEYIKQQILHKLGMNKPPKFDNKRVDINSYLKIFETSTVTPQPTDSYSTSTTEEESDKLFIFQMKGNALNAEFNFTLNKESLTYPIKNIALFVKEHKSFFSSYFGDDEEKEITIVSKITNPDLSLTDDTNSTMRVLGMVTVKKDKDVNSVSEKKLSQNWLQYDVTDILIPELTTDQIISIESENFDITDSFFIIEFDYENVQRNKRSVDCNASGNSSACCRESFYVNFTDIGWNDWILQPIGYYANYCKGKCDISHARYHHTTVTGNYPTLINLCCSPRKMSHISVIYIQKNGYVVQTNLQNMVVESCDCA